MKKVGFFGGSFDPIHFGHINLALELLEIHQLDQVLFCPAKCSPFKLERPPQSSEIHRLKMVQVAIEEIPKFQVCTLELDQPGPSFTVDTLRTLSKEGNSLRLILSEEAATHFEQWREYQEILRLAPPLVGTRRGGAPSIPAFLKGGLTETRALEISSTDIRTRLKKKLYCGHLIPAKTLDYIQRHHLYCS